MYYYKDVWGPMVAHYDALLCIPNIQSLIICPAWDTNFGDTFQYWPAGPLAPIVLPKVDYGDSALLILCGI